MLGALSSINSSRVLKDFTSLNSNKPYYYCVDIKTIYVCLKFYYFKNIMGVLWNIIIIILMIK